MNNNKQIFENPIIYLLITLIMVGTVMMYSASSTIGINKFNQYSFYLNKHLIRLAISIIAFIIIYNIDFKWFKRFLVQCGNTCQNMLQDANLISATTSDFNP